MTNPISYSSFRYFCCVFDAKPPVLSPVLASCKHKNIIQDPQGSPGYPFLVSFSYRDPTGTPQNPQGSPGLPFGSVFLAGTPQGLPRTPRDRQGSLFGQLFLQGPHRELPGPPWIPRGRRFVRLFVCLFIAFCIKAHLLLLLALLLLLHLLRSPR